MHKNSAATTLSEHQECNQHVYLSICIGFNPVHLSQYIRELGNGDEDGVSPGPWGRSALLPLSK